MRIRTARDRREVPSPDPPDSRPADAAHPLSSHAVTHPALTDATSRDQARLEAMVVATPWLMAMLRAVRDVGPPGAYVAAGTIRNAVWDILHDRTPMPTSDVDVVHVAEGGSDAAYTRALENRLPEHGWEVTNQRLVHEWQSRRLGYAVPPYRTLDEALRVWPETATAIAVAMTDDGRLHVIAPHGLADLFALVVRPSPALLDATAYHARCTAKKWQERWPKLRVS